MPETTITFIGHGEAAQAFARGWKAGGIPVTVTSFDVDSMKSHCTTRAQALKNAGIIFSLVTPDQAFVALKECRNFIPETAIIFDGNSCAPDTKRRTATLVSALGAKYVDMAIMSPVHPKLHKTPLLISGDHTSEALIIFERLSMDATIIAGEVGAASSIKMIRSIMMKGLEALTMECVLAGRAARVEETILQSLNASFPGFNWPKRAGYMMERMTTHGTRRAAEMREVVKTIEQLGFSADMAAATVEWQARIGALDIDAYGGFQQIADDILAKVKP